MTEIRPMTMEAIREYFGDSLPDGLGSTNFVHTAELLLALAVDACEETANYASSAIETDDGRHLVVTARYLDGIPLVVEYAEMKSQRDRMGEMLEEVLKALESLPDDALGMETIQQTEQGAEAYPLKHELEGNIKAVLALGEKEE